MLAPIGAGYATYHSVMLEHGLLAHKTTTAAGFD